MSTWTGVCVVVGYLTILGLALWLLIGAVVWLATFVGQLPWRKLAVVRRAGGRDRVGRDVSGVQDVGGVGRHRHRRCAGAGVDMPWLLGTSVTCLPAARVVDRRQPSAPGHVICSGALGARWNSYVVAGNHLLT